MTENMHEFVGVDNSNPCEQCGRSRYAMNHYLIPMPPTQPTVTEMPKPLGEHTFEEWLRKTHPNLVVMSSEEEMLRIELAEEAWNAAKGVQG